MTPDAKLAAYLKTDAAPARDLAFEAVVAERIARRRAVLSVVALLPWTLAAVVGLWGLRPVVADLALVGMKLEPIAVICALAAFSVLGVLSLTRVLGRT